MELNTMTAVDFLNEVVRQMRDQVDRNVNPAVKVTTTMSYPDGEEAPFTLLILPIPREEG